MTDPIREWANGRKLGGYTLPDTAPPAEQVAPESLTPGTGRTEPATNGDVFRQMLIDDIGGVYGA